ncbi:MAG: hypothetical protein V1646_05175 [bacterium]
MVINLKNKYLFILLSFLSVFCAPLCAQYALTQSPDSQSIDLSGAIKNVCLDVVLANGLKQTETTQTLAYLGHSGLHGEVSNVFSPKISEIGLDFFKSLLKSVIQNEIRFKNDYYVFYHGQPRDFALMQDLYHGLTKIVYQKEICDFVMLRIPTQDQFGFKTVIDFLKYYIRNDEIFRVQDFDLQSHIKKILLSVNPSLFGNTFGAGCSTLEYFLCSTGCTFVDTSELIERTFEFFGLQSVYYENQFKIKELQESLCVQEKEKTGLLQQIFVPKSIVDLVAYRSVPLGSLYYEDRNPDGHLASVDLNDYEGNKSSDDFSFDVTQFRLLMNEPMLDPTSGVKIFRYCNETAKFIEYKIKLKELLGKIKQYYES